MEPLILVADDDPIIRTLCCSALEQEGFRTVEADSATAAILAFDERDPDLVLLDVLMPGEDGIECLHRLRSHPRGRNVPVAMITGLDDGESIQRAYDAGATDFITKPLNWVILCQRVRYMLRTSRMADDLRQSEFQLTHAQHIARLASWQLDIATNEMSWLGGSEDVLGRARSEIQTLDDFLLIVPPADREAIREALDQSTETGKYSLGHRIQLIDGGRRHVHAEAALEAHPNGRGHVLIGTLQDVTDRVRAEQRIWRLAYLDPVTGLANASLFHDRTAETIEIARQRERSFAVIILGIDQFRRINETCGRDIGDRVLRTVARRIQAWLEQESAGREGWGGTCPAAARLGADYFGLLVPDVSSVFEAHDVARRLADVLRTYVHLNDVQLGITSCVGVSVFPSMGDDADQLGRNAEMALHQAQSLGTGMTLVYADELGRAAHARLSLEGDLGRALERQELTLVFQPQICIGSGAIVGAEALLRWQHPRLGTISPLDFIPLAESTGLIVPIGEWVLLESCRQAQRWREAFGIDLRLGVNLSSVQFEQSSAIGSVCSALSTTGSTAESLELEITESVIMRDAKDTKARLSKLKDTGVRLAVDDFGTGYSSLSYLKSFPLDTLKIDRSFLTGVPDKPKDREIAQAIVTMAKGLNLNIVAEGVERAEQLTFLHSIGCDESQGYYHARPMDALAFEGYLSSGNLARDGEAA